MVRRCDCGFLIEFPAYEVRGYIKDRTKGKSDILLIPVCPKCGKPIHDLEGSKKNE